MKENHALEVVLVFALLLFGSFIIGGRQDNLLTGLATLPGEYEKIVNQTMQQALSRPCFDGNAKCFYKDQYVCAGRKWIKNQTCSFDCLKGECIECRPWKDSKGFNMYEGSQNKCMGDDVYRCIGGRWEKAVTCPYGCKNDTVIKTDEMEITMGHCRCFYGAESLCVNNSFYECVGFDAITKPGYPYYTKVGSCDQPAWWAAEAMYRAKPCAEGELRCYAGRRWVCNDDGFLEKTRERCSAITLRTINAKVKKKG